MFTLAQAAIFNAWWKDTLYEGAAWFASNWSHPQATTAVRKFVAAPKWGDYVPGQLWPVSAEFEVRGRGELPRTYDGILLLHMEGVSSPLVLIDEYGHDGAVDNSDGNASGLVASSPLVGAGSLYMEPYGTGGGFGRSVGFIPASSDFALNGSFTINLSHTTGTYRGQSGIYYLLTTSTASAIAGQWGIVQSGGTDLVFYINSDSTTQVTASVAMPSGRVDIEAARTDDGHLLLFLNGALVDTSTGTTLVPLVGSAIGIGGRPDGTALPNDYADGWYDEIRIVPSALHVADYTPSFPLPRL